MKLENEIMDNNWKVYRHIFPNGKVILVLLIARLKSDGVKMERNIMVRQLVKLLLNMAGKIYSILY